MVKKIRLKSVWLPGWCFLQSLLILGWIFALLGLNPSPLLAQSSPLTVQPSTGRVGIGTTSPSNKLHVLGPGGGSVVALFEQPGGSMNFVDLRSATGGGNYGSVLRFVDSGVVNAEVKSTANSRLMFATAGVERVTIENNGNVGIGTASPGVKLDISGVGENAIRITSSDVGNNRSVLLGTNQGGNAAFVEVAQDPALASKRWQMGITTNDRFFIGHPGELEKVTVLTGGNVGVGISNPSSLLHVNGTFTATSKNFEIDHPLEPDKKHLVHSALEGPEVAVYYRGKAQLVNGEAVIELPSYFEALTQKEQRTVQLTSIGGWAPLYVEDEVKDGHFKVKAANGSNPNQRFYWEVKAVRADVPDLVVEKAKEAAQLKLAENAKVAP